MLSDKLTFNLLVEQMETSDFSRGLDYHRQGMVEWVDLREDTPQFCILESSTAGSYRKAYKQSIALESEGRGRVIIDGDCNCPVGFNCKHVVAACLTFIAQRQQARQVKGVQTELVKEPDYVDWLQALEKAGNADTPANEEWIAYLLSPGEQPGMLRVDLKITRLNARGSLNRGRKLSASKIHQDWVEEKYIQLIDRSIAKILVSMQTGGWYGNLSIHTLSGHLGSLVLNMLLDSERCFWQETRGPLVSRGEAKELTMQWQTNAQGGVQLRPDLDANIEVLLTTPPLYLDKESHCIGPLEVAGLEGDGNPQRLGLLLDAPVIPEQETRTFSKRLINEFSSVPLQAPKPVKVTTLNEVRPVPVLVIHVENQISLSFSYEGHKVDASDVENPIVFDVPDGMVSVERDLSIESDASNQLLEAGFTTVYGPSDRQAQSYQDILSLDNLDNSQLWLMFMEETIPELEVKGWQIQQDQGFNLRFEEADDWYFRIDDDEPGNDWFSLHFDLQIGGEKLHLLPVVAQVIENYDGFRGGEELPEVLLLQMEEGRYVKLPSKRIKPVIDNLMELFDQQGMNKDHSMQLSRFDAPKLNQLSEQTNTQWQGGEALREFGQRLKDFDGIQAVEPAPSLNAQLRDYQQSGLNWLQFLREYQIGGVLADDMGLGKTLQVLAHLQVEKAAGRLNKPVLVVAPTSLMGNWRREAEKFTPDLSVLILQGHDRKTRFKLIKKHDIILTTYPLLTRDAKVLKKHHYHSLVLDEAQVIKNAKSKAAQMARQLKCDHRLAITGTPMENHLGELWALFDFLIPGFLGSSGSFSRTYRKPIEKLNDDQRRADLSRRIAPFMLRRSKSEVADELPAKTEILRSVAFDDEQAMLYESIRLTMEKKVRDSIAAKGLASSHITILDALLKLRQTCCDPRLLPLDRAKKVKQSAKLEMLMQLLPEQLEEGRRILLFSQFTKMLALIETELKQRGIAYTKLTGQTRKRDEAIERFTGGEVDVFLISLKAGGVGLNLTEADTVIHYDPWWNPAVETQATDRAHRIGQQKPVFVYKLIVENSVEEKIVAMQDSKRALAEGIYKNNESESGSALSADDLKDLFAPLKPGS